MSAREQQEENGAPTEGARDSALDAEWNVDAMELVVAELTAAMALEPSPASLPMPDAIVERLVAAGEPLVRRPPTPRIDAANSTPAHVPQTARRSTGDIRRWSGWMAAAAVLALWIGSARWAAIRTPARTSDAFVVVARPSARVRQLRDSLLRHDPAATRVAWSATSDSAATGATGDVVWSARAQAGAMRFAGLRPNDRARWQYQLWIFDKRRDQRFPVDGGVFNIPEGVDEVLVPIAARVPVGEAVLFAVTVEKAGGVVVSSRERIALLAKSGD